MGGYTIKHAATVHTQLHVRFNGWDGNPDDGTVAARSMGRSWKWVLVIQKSLKLLQDLRRTPNARCCTGVCCWQDPGDACESQGITLTIHDASCIPAKSRSTSTPLWQQQKLFSDIPKQSSIICLFHLSFKKRATHLHSAEMNSMPCYACC